MYQAKSPLTIELFRELFKQLSYVCACIANIILLIISLLFRFNGFWVFRITTLYNVNSSGFFISRLSNMDSITKKKMLLTRQIQHLRVFDKSLVMSVGDCVRKLLHSDD